MKFIKDKLVPISFNWYSLFIFTFVAAHLYVVSEWIFIITKPSFLNAVPLIRKVDILLFTSSLLTFICFFGLALLLVVDYLMRHRTNSKIFLVLGSLIPVSIIASLVIILIDNFTYTILKFGIISSNGFTTGLYLLSFLFFLSFIYIKSTNFLSKLGQMERLNRKTKFVISTICLYIAFSLLLTYKGNDFRIPGPEINGVQINSKYPNIIILTGDGIDANNTSAYGYEFDTTPNLKELAKTSLVAENSFTNAGNTAGSLISLFTSKYPTENSGAFSPGHIKK